MTAVRRLNSKLVGTSGGRPRHILPYLSHPPSSRRFSFRIDWCIGVWQYGQSVKTTGFEFENMSSSLAVRQSRFFSFRILFLDVFRRFFSHSRQESPSVVFFNIFSTAAVVPIFFRLVFALLFVLCYPYPVR